jgi:ankyrin repeat protein
MDPNLPNWQWTTPLHELAQTNPMGVRKGRMSTEQRRERALRRARMDLFLEFGADLEAVDEEYRSTPLGWAARSGQEDAVRLLLARGADPNGGQDWARPLLWAERRGHRSVARTLRKAGAR